MFFTWNKLGVKISQKFTQAQNNFSQDSLCVIFCCCEIFTTISFRASNWPVYLALRWLILDIKLYEILVIPRSSSPWGQSFLPGRIIIIYVLTSYRPWENKIWYLPLQSFSVGKHFDPSSQRNWFILQAFLNWELHPESEKFYLSLPICS